MGLSKAAIKRLEQIGKGKSSSLAKEASEKLSDGTKLLIDWYYESYTPKYYDRTWNLYNSYEPFLKNGAVYFGGVKIPGANMHSYPGIKNDPIKPWDFMSTYIYNPAGTWHGGDWHGGYGEKADFLFYEELHHYHEQLKKEYKKRCTV